jgi:hypothetical protein
LSNRIRVSFVHSADNRRADVVLSSALTVSEVIQKLINANFLAKPANDVEYILQIEGNSKFIDPSETLGAAGVQDGSILVTGSLTQGDGTIKISIPDNSSSNKLESLSTKTVTSDNIFCPICRSTVYDSMSLAICTKCGTVYHAECVQVVYNRCTNCGSSLIAINAEKSSFTGNYEIIVSQSQEIAVGDAIVVNQTPEKGRSKSSLREWWHNILRSHGKFSCYAIFLVLPSDKQALTYLTEFGKEIDLISADDCLVVALGGTDFRRSGFDEKLWNIAIKQQIDDGHSINISKLFDFKLSDFPALMLFKSIHNPDHVMVSLREMDSSQIATYMRKIFTVISEAVKNNQDPLKALTQHRNSEKIQATSKGAISELRSFTGKTFERAIEVWLTTMIK